MAEIGRWQQEPTLGWRDQTPGRRKQAFGQRPQAPGWHREISSLQHQSFGWRRQFYGRRQHFWGQRHQSWNRGGHSEGKAGGERKFERRYVCKQGEICARGGGGGRVVDHDDDQDEENEEKSRVEIMTLGGDVACAVRVKSPSDEKELSKAVSNELHLPEECFQLIVTESIVNVVFKRDYAGWDRLFDRACEMKDDLCARNVYKALDDDESFFYFRPLHLAIFHQSPCIVKLLLEMQADPNAETTNGLEKAAHIAARSADQATLELLLAAKVDVNSVNSDGDRPLHLAACRRDPSFVRLLLDAKADIMAENHFGETAFASVQYSNHADVREVLNAHLVSY
mmetsp:Transcript_94271/g.177381  ORF Transcript_94271/g.177381 Transcript_94271/m.177381 type:complete len:340 (+) Transcript_94271:39-1058(+)